MSHPAHTLIAALSLASVLVPSLAAAGPGVGCCAFAGPNCIAGLTQGQCVGEMGTYFAGATCNAETKLCTGAPVPTPTAPPAQVSALISTERGCLENGDAAVFAVGEPIAVLFRIQSETVEQATATILDRPSNHVVSEIFHDIVPTNQTVQLTGFTVTPPTGVETLQLTASAPGATDSIDQCSFEVIQATTLSASPTPTPTPTPTPPIAQRQLYFEADDVHDGGQITVVINVFPPGGGAPIPITAMVTVNPGDDAEAIARKWAMEFQKAAAGKVTCRVDVRATDSPNVWCVFIECTNATSIGVDLPPLGTIPNGTAVGPNVIFITPTPSATRTRTPTRTPFTSPTRTRTRTGTATRTITGTRLATPTSTVTVTATRTDTRTATVTATAVDTATATPVTVHMDLEIYRLDGTRLPDDEGGDPDQEETIGSMVCVNNDNDDHNLAVDIDQQNVPGENDLIRVVARRPPIPPSGLARLVATRGGDKVKVWTSAEKTTEVALPAAFDVSELPREFWVEGREGSTAQRDVQFELQGPAAPGLVAIADRVSLTVIQITETAWVGKANSLTDSDELDADPHGPHWPGALRVFPDARALAGPARDAVTVRVTLSVEPVAELNIFLRAFDVDDPAPLDADVDLNDDGTAGTYPHTAVAYTADEDNRGAVGGHKAGELDGQDIDGIATLTFAGTDQADIDFQVTMQPGDNFRVAAACDQAYLRELRNRDQTDHEDIVDRNNGVVIRDGDKQITPVLTVWRRVHVERDSMAALMMANTINGHLTGVAAGPMPGTSVVTTDQNLIENNQYVCGAGQFPAPCRLAVAGREFDVLSNLSGPASTVTVRHDVTGAPPNDRDFTLHDDDRDNILPRVPDTGWMRDSDVQMDNLYAAAYIRPVFDGGGNPANDRNDVAATLHTPDANAVAQVMAGKNVTGDDEFWVSYIQSVFQGQIDHDRDPDTEAWELGFTPPGTDDASIIYQENATDLARDAMAMANGATREDIERATVVHEVGHQFSADHADMAIMDGVWPTTVAIPRNFSNASLNRIRSTRRPGGGVL